MKKLLSKSLLKKPKDIIAKGLLWVKNCIQVSALPLVTVIIVFPASPIWAKNCPSVPKETKEVTVKDDDATLRIEPKKSSQKGSPIGKGDKLGVINNKPTQDSEGND
jgi:hypothetical protein